MELDLVPDMLTSAVDVARATGDEKTASMLESFAPLVGSFVAQARRNKNDGRARFVADLAAHFLVGALESALDSDQDTAPIVRRAVRVANQIVTEAERVCAAGGK